MNKISAEITPAQLAEFKEAVEQLKAKFPWLINLTPDERNTGMRIGDKSYTFVSKVLEYSQSHPEFLPSYMDLGEVNKDFKLWGDLNTLIRNSNLLSDALNDTAIQAGTEAMEGALAYYNAVKEAAKRNAPGAQTIYDDLKMRFAAKNTSNQKELASK